MDLITQLKQLQLAQCNLEQTIMAELADGGSISSGGYSCKLVSKKRAITAEERAIELLIEQEELKLVEDNLLKIYEYQSAISKAEGGIAKLIRSDKLKELKADLAKLRSRPEKTILEIKLDKKSEAVYAIVSKEDFNNFKKKSRLSKSELTEYILLNGKLPVIE